MILNHLMGLYTHPKEEWHTIEKNHEALKSSLSHILLITLIPVICTFIATTYIGWDLGIGERHFLTVRSAFFMSLSMYVGLLAGTFILAYLIFWMAKTFDAKPTYTQSLELVAYTATPLFMVGFATLFPVLWFIMIIGLIGLAYSVYLLFTGVPIIMNIHEDKSIVYTLSVLTAGFILLSALMGTSAILWSWGLAPVYQ
ncbi:Yip1 family protein [Shewanella surugensis]|uniref:YIP1 family protein n=1 Tax=Shewanella surugensis TaxID=212020 RepID=A0ABT0LHI7_9GAMM|nr:Yip1 family protein [Shewanella surugensis]MCL1127029.1 YIP1 family protein [Shewanella surugensis]